MRTLKRTMQIIFISFKHNDIIWNISRCSFGKQTGKNFEFLLVLKLTKYSKTWIVTVKNISTLIKCIYVSCDPKNFCWTKKSSLRTTGTIRMSYYQDIPGIKDLYRAMDVRTFNWVIEPKGLSQNLTTILNQIPQ